MYDIVTAHPLVAASCSALCLANSSTSITLRGLEVLVDDLEGCEEGDGAGAEEEAEAEGMKNAPPSSGRSE